MLLKRIIAAANSVPPDSRVADIGCDHGKLSVYLRQSKIASSVIATDIREKPLKNAEKNIYESKMDNIETRLCDGFDGISPDEIDAAIIAGMGGVVIAGIIDRAPWLKCEKYTLILQPMTSAEYLRKYLCENGFYIEPEQTLAEDGKIYTIIKTKFDGKIRKKSTTYYYTGERDFSTPEAKEYSAKLLRRLKGESAAWQGEEKQKEYKTLCDDLEKLSHYGE